jgi:hypothetical protein
MAVRRLWSGNIALKLPGKTPQSEAVSIRKSYLLGPLLGLADRSLRTALRSEQGLIPFFNSERDRRHLC